MKLRSDTLVPERAPDSVPGTVDALRRLRTRHSFEADIERSRVPDAIRRPALAPNNYRMLVLLGTDVLAVVACIGLGFVLASGGRTLIEGRPTFLEPHSWSTVGLVFAVPLLVTGWQSWLWGHYTRFRPVWTELRELLKLALVIAATDALLLWMREETFSRLWLGCFLGLYCVLMPLGRHAARRWMTRRDRWFTPTWVVGTGDNASMTAAALESDPALGHRVDGFVDLHNELEPGTTLAGKPVHARLPDAPTTAGREPPCIVFALESLQELRQYRELLNRCIASSSVVTISPPISGLPLYGAEIVNVFRHDTVVLKLQNNINSRSARFAKRASDLALSSLALAALSPLMLVVGWLTARDGGSPFYGHVRIGRDGQEFPCWKFRTMVTDADARLRELLASDPAARLEWEATRKLRNDPRITRVGRFLRSTSLDELPQLVNVLRGEMSLVGPRPIVSDETAHYGEYLPYYLSMVPGITGLWQSSGRSDTSYRERVLLDVWYARNWCLWHDLVILLRTFPSLVSRVGAH